MRQSRGYKTRHEAGWINVVRNNTSSRRSDLPGHRGYWLPRAERYKRRAKISTGGMPRRLGIPPSFLVYKTSDSLKHGGAHKSATVGWRRDKRNFRVRPCGWQRDAESAGQRRLRNERRGQIGKSTGVVGRHS